VWEYGQPAALKNERSLAATAWWRVDAFETRSLAHEAKCSQSSWRSSSAPGQAGHFGLPLCSESTRRRTRESPPTTPPKNVEENKNDNPNNTDNNDDDDNATTRSTTDASPKRTSSSRARRAKSSSPTIPTHHAPPRQQLAPPPNSATSGAGGAAAASASTAGRVEANPAPDGAAISADVGRGCLRDARLPPARSTSPTASASRTANRQRRSASRE
jgi:cytoskeletal protein RodZ